ncbi:MAG: response regulator transcription factor [candidate division WOR-3 bacterium]
MEKKSKKIKIFILDDHDSVRESYKRYFESYGYEVIGESKDFDGLLSFLNKNSPHIVLMDIDFPDNPVGGIEKAKELLRQNKDLKIVFITHYTEPEIIKNAIESGAIGYFTKADGLKCLKEAIENSYNGNLYISPTAIKNIIKALDKLPVSFKKYQNFNLSEKEIEILNLVAEGLTNKEIAKKLGTSEKRIKNTISTIIYKLGAKNRANLVAIGIKYGLIKI